MRKEDSPLRAARRSRLMPQDVFASLLHVSQQTVSKAERGLLSLSPDLQELAAVILGKARHELFPKSVVAEPPTSAELTR